MLYLIDSAELKKIKSCLRVFPIDGVTTNPSLLAATRDNAVPLLREIRKAIGTERLLFVQTTEEYAELILAEAQILREKIGGNLVVKIPMTEDGLRAMRAVSELGIPVAATTVFTAQQAMLAAKAGASFVAPFVNRLDSAVGNGVQVVADIAALFHMHDVPCKLLAASFKTAEQIQRVMRAGADAVTVNPDLYPQLLEHPLTDVAVGRFRNDWQERYGTRKLGDMLQ